MSDARERAADAVITPLVASLGVWGVQQGHWLPARDGSPVLWLQTRTEAQRVALEGQVWLSAQLHVLLQRVGMPPHQVSGVRIEITSAEVEGSLWD